MMTTKPIIAIAIVTLLSFTAYGQKDSLYVLVKLPEFYNIPGATLTLQIDGKMRTYALSLDSLHTIKIPLSQNKKRDKQKILLSYNNVGYGSLKWDKIEQFIGSDTALLTFRKRAGGQSLIFDMQVNQYPLIEFESAGSPHEVEVDGEVIGNTSTNRTVTPNTKHTLVWKKGSIKVCSQDVKLGYNQSRKYRCNADGTLTEL